MILPQQNARLKSIKAGGVQRTYGQAPTDGAVKWQGDVSAYYMTKWIKRIGTSNTLDRVKEISLIIPGDLVPAFDLENGDKAEFTFLGKTMTLEILGVRAPVGPFGTGRYARLDLREFNKHA